MNNRSVSLMLLLALAVPATVLAQAADTADLNGVVVDASGKPVAGYPMKVNTPQWGQVILKPTEDDGTFAVNALPPGSYEFRVFDPGGSPDNPIASKQVTLAAGQKEKIEIRLTSGKSGRATASKPAAGLPVGATTLGTTGVNWTMVQIVGLAFLAALGVFLVMRSQRRPAA